MLIGLREPAEGRHTDLERRPCTFQSFPALPKSNTGYSLLALTVGRFLGTPR